MLEHVVAVEKLDNLLNPKYLAAVILKKNKLKADSMVVIS